ncbi:MAG: carboxypeptidase regulatory-like domain-containing protein, partial [Candidatus Acidiferrales bacterium]
MRIRWVLLLVFGLLLAGATAFAQVSTSRIVGTVTDASGAVVPGAKVIATNEATGITYETTTTESGAYSFTALQVGNYSITVEATGFKKWIGTKNELNVGSPLVLNTALEVGEITSTVQVESSYERLKTSDAMISDVVDRRAIRDLPLNGRNPLNLITLQPGLIQRSTGGAGSGTHINGSRDRAFNITLDGIDANEPSVPNPQSNVFRLNTDNVQEYRIVTHNATAEFGRSSGANVALASRAGTNEIHGNLFEYFRNPVLNAKDFFVNLQNQDKPDFKIHQFGADVGGPVIKNKTFWFASWQSQRLGFTQPIQEIFGNPTVYTATARMGIYRFVRGTVTLPDGTTRSSNSTALVDSQGNLLPGIATCGGSVTTNCVDQYNITTNTPGFGLDPVMGTYIGDMPLPNNFSASGDGLNTAAFLWNPPSSQPELRFLFRVDHQFDENNSVFGRYTWANADTKGGDFLNARPQVFPGYPPLGLVNRRPRNLALSYRRVFSPRLVNEFTAGYSRFLFDFLFGRANPDFPNIVPFVSGVISEPFLNQSGTARWLTTIQYIDNLSYTTGNHLFRGGINFRFVRHNDERSFVGAVNNAPNVTFASTRIDATTFGLPATGTGGINGTDQTRLRNMMSDML